MANMVLEPVYYCCCICEALCPCILAHNTCSFLPSSLLSLSSFLSLFPSFSFFSFFFPFPVFFPLFFCLWSCLFFHSFHPSFFLMPLNFSPGMCGRFRQRSSLLLQAGEGGNYVNFLWDKNHIWLCKAYTNS